MRLQSDFETGYLDFHTSLWQLKPMGGPWKQVGGNGYGEQNSRYAGGSGETGVIQVVV